DRKHVVARLHVQPRRLLIQAHERERWLSVLDQIDPSLVMLDRVLAITPVGEAGADLAMKLGLALELAASAMVRERPLPRVDRRVDAAESQGDVALLLEQPRERVGVVGRQLARRAVLRERFGIGVERGRRVCRRLQVAQRLLAVGLELRWREAELEAELG